MGALPFVRGTLPHLRDFHFSKHPVGCGFKGVPSGPALVEGWLGQKIKTPSWSKNRLGQNWIDQNWIGPNLPNQDGQNGTGQRSCWQETANLDATECALLDSGSRL